MPVKYGIPAAKVTATPQTTNRFRVIKISKATIGMSTGSQSTWHKKESDPYAIVK
jgi:hypothetical protein